PHQRVPVFDEVGRVAVDLEPRERLAENVAVRERTLRTRTRRQIAQPPLQTDNVAEALHVAARNRQIPELWSRRAAIRIGRCGRPRRALRYAAVFAGIRIACIECRRFVLTMSMPAVAGAIFGPSSVKRDAQSRKQAA